MEHVVSMSTCANVALVTPVSPAKQVCAGNLTTYLPSQTTVVGVQGFYLRVCVCFFFHTIAQKLLQYRIIELNVEMFRDESRNPIYLFWGLKEEKVTSHKKPFPAWVNFKPTREFKNRLHACAHIIVHNCRTQYNTAHF